MLASIFKTKNSFLLILPIFFIILGYYLKAMTPNYSLSCVDPEYCYLFNGLNLAHHNFPFHIDHPGTPLQIFSAIIIRVVHLFRPDTLDSDLFKNPELYLHAVNYALIYLQAIVLVFVGFVIYLITKNCFIALFIQLSPFASSALLNQNRVMVEQMEIIAGLLLIVSIFWFLYSNKETKSLKWINKYVIIFSILIGFGVSVKLLYAPIIILPFLLLPGIKQKLTFVFLSVISFGIFAFPIFNRWVPFREWIKSLFIHSGQYGGGAANIVDKDSFITNLNTIMHTGKVFPFAIVILILACFIYQIPVIKRKVRNEFYYKALLGITLAIIFTVLIVSKQFKYFYLTPALILIVFGLFITIRIFFYPIVSLRKNWIALISIIVFCGFTYKYELKEIPLYREIAMQQIKPYLESKKIIIEKYNNKPKLVLSRYYGAPYVEYSVFFGTAWSGDKMTNYYSKTQKEIYPNTYVYHGWNNSFNTLWMEGFSYIDLLKKHKEIILYSGDPQVEIYLNSKLRGINRMLDTKYDKVYTNEITNEVIYYVFYDSTRNTNVYKCDAEIVDTVSGCFKNPEGLLFEYGKTQSSDYAKSGSYSSKLTGLNPYGFTCSISEAQKGDNYKISVWVLMNDNRNNGLVLSANNSNDLYLFQNKVIEKSGNWVKYEINYTISKEIHNKDLKIYCWNNDGSNPVYFDDFEIKKIIK
jgi:hypothetical protein